MVELRLEKDVDVLMLNKEMMMVAWVVLVFELNDLKTRPNH